eukprot:1160104-Pelagomonas_calceolata.AAC.2
MPVHSRTPEHQNITMQPTSVGNRSISAATSPVLTKPHHCSDSFPGERASVNAPATRLLGTAAKGLKEGELVTPLRESAAQPLPVHAISKLKVSGCHTPWSLGTDGSRVVIGCHTPQSLRTYA